MALRTGPRHWDEGGLMNKDKKDIKVPANFPKPLDVRTNVKGGFGEKDLNTQVP